MMQLWQWLRGREGRAGLLGLVVLVGFSGCRSAGSRSSYSDAPSVSPGPAVPLTPQAVPPYEDSAPILTPPLKTQTKLDATLGEPVEPQELVGTPTETPLTKSLPSDEPMTVVREPESVTSQTPRARDVFADEPLPPAPQVTATVQKSELASPSAPNEELIEPVVPRASQAASTETSDALEVKKPITSSTLDEQPQALFKSDSTPSVKSTTDTKLDDPLLPEFKSEVGNRDALKTELPPTTSAQPAFTEQGELQRVEPRATQKPQTAPLSNTDDDEVIPVPNADRGDAASRARQNKEINRPNFDVPAAVPALPDVPLPVVPGTTSSDKTSAQAVVKPTSNVIASRSDTSKPAQNSLPEITAVPVANVRSRSVLRELLAENSTEPQVVGRTAKMSLAAQTSSAPTPGAFSDVNASLPLRTPVRISDVAEFDQPADHLVVLNDGSVLVSHRSSISRITTDKRVETFSRPGSPRGLVPLHTGFALCDVSQRALLKLDAQGLVTEKIAIKSDGYFLRAPKDVVVDANGGIYFTDPGYARSKNPIGQIHYVGTNGKVSVVAQKLAYPDGLALSTDGSRLYVVEGQADQVLSFELLAAGKVGPKTVLAKLPHDGKKDDGSATGIAVDQRGRIYVAQRDQSRVQVIDPDGRILTSYQCGALLLSDLAIVPGAHHQLLVSGNLGATNGHGKVLRLELSGR